MPTLKCSLKFEVVEPDEEASKKHGVKLNTILGDSHLVGELEIGSSVWNPNPMLGDVVTSRQQAVAIGMERFLVDAVDAIQEEAGKISRGEHAS